ncbi:ribose-phosphate pyrophosphokinase [Buchnera aphidicola]|uniref:ribose-phosphate pyrophosphokinase n=1 Tax=Buchnera aphidicola TaxID=9 RepID=UPI003463D2E3
MNNMKIFSGNSVPKLAQLIAQKLYKNLSQATVSKFSDGEISVQIHDNVRGDDIFIVQSTCSPTNDNIIELAIIVDALRRASAGRITAVIPYFGYARQDRRIRSARMPITAKIIADFFSHVGIDRILTIDLHAEQIQGFFDIPVDNIFGNFILLEDMLKLNLKNPVIVSPDIGGVIRARAIAKLLYDTDMAIIDKRRPKPNVSEVMNIIGNVSNRDCVLVDDMIDTGNTLCKAARALKNHGAQKIFAYATHPILSGNAAEKLEQSNIDEIIVCDTIPLEKEIISKKKIRTLTVSEMLAEAILRIKNEESISAMFEYQKSMKTYLKQ